MTTSFPGLFPWRFEIAKGKALGTRLDSVTDRLFTFVVVLSHRIMNDHRIATQNEIMTQRFHFG